MAVGFYVAKYVNKKSDMDLAAKGLGAKEWNNSLKTKLSLLPKKLFRIRMSRNFGMKMLTMTNLSTECLIQLTKLGYDATPFNQILKQNVKREMRLRLGKVTVADVLAAQPVTTNLLKFMRASIKMIGVSNLQSFIASMTQKLTLSDISDESKNYLDKAGITTACLRIKSQLTAHLEVIGFERVPMVEDVAQFSVRGGIFDIYSFGMAEPVRLEFWGDDVTELRHFDLLSQRSTRDAEVALVLPVDGQISVGDGEPERSSIRALFPPDTLLVVPRGTHMRPELERTWAEAQHHIDLARRRGEDTPSRDELFESPDTTIRALNALGAIDLSGDDPQMTFPFREPEEIQRDIKRLKQIVADGIPTIILCDNAGQAERLDELLNDDRVSPAILAIGVLDGGFVIPPRGASFPGYRVFTDHEIFRRERRFRRARRYVTGTALESLTALKPGDYVVHLEHGVGIYRGIEKMYVRESTVEVAV